MSNIVVKAAEFAGKAGNDKLQKAVAVAGAKLEKAAPTIFVVTGVVGLIGAGVLACRSTLKVEGVIDRAKEQLDDVHYCEERLKGQGPEPEYSSKDAQHDKAVVYARTGLELARLYGPSILLGAGSVILILSSHRMMEQRNTALIGAYEMAAAGFKQYRNHIREEYGEDADRRALYGLTTEKIEVEKEDKSGKKRKGKEEIEVFDPNSISRYAVFFDEGSTQWEPNPEYNKAFVIGMQNTANDLLHANGYLFLNTVYRLLGLPETSEGQLVGWMMGKGDDFVDFGIYDDAYLRTEKRDFVNGFEPSILLDFNVDGVIYKEI